MQSLGKVPSARRPPTNLPSLKAETLTPPSSIQSTNEPQNTQSQASWADSNSSSVPSGNNKKNNNNSNNASNTVAIKTISNSNQLNTNNQQQQQQQQRGGDTRDSSNLSTSPSSTSWSVVATGGNLKEEILPHPPIYQSPQFQNEFPSLDGSIPANVNVIQQQKTQQQNQYHNSTEIGGNANSSLNLRPQTDAASWMQQQQSNSGNVRGAGVENGQQNYQPDQDHLNTVPSKFMALMPSFMLRGQGGGGGGGGGGQQQQQQQQQQQMNTSNHQSSNSHHQNSNNNNYHQQNQGRTNQGRNINNNNNNNNNNYGGGGGNGGQYNDYSNSQNSMRRQPAPRHSGNNNNQQRGGQNDERNTSSYEPDVVSQRPIIKEEELDRIDSLAKDDGWAKHDEIDYNKKLQFSDDENMEEISSAKPKMQILQHDEINNMRHSKNDDQSGKFVQ